MIEVELKARVADPGPLLGVLRRRARGVANTYRDTYYDFPDRRLQRRERQLLRLRVIESGDGDRCRLTFKGAMLDAGAVPELETEVARADTAGAILAALGLRPVISYTKQCENFTFAAYGREVVASVVRVPELTGTFVEVESLAHEPGDTEAARAAVRSVLTELSLGEADLEPSFYVDLVAAERAR